MNSIEHLEETKWTFGYVVYARNRDSSILEDVNYKEILKDLEKLATELGEENNVYDFRAIHWACGWIEYIIIEESASDKLKQAAGEIICNLASYPVYNEDKWAEAEYEAKQKHWRDCSVKERIELIREHNPDCSIFAARKDYYDEKIDHNGGFLDFIY